MTTKLIEQMVPCAIVKCISHGIGGIEYIADADAPITANIKDKLYTAAEIQRVLDAREPYAYEFEDGQILFKIDLEYAAHMTGQQVKPLYKD